MNANEVHRVHIEFECAESLRTLFAVRVPAISGAIVELDTRLTGLRRSAYLRALARGEEAEVVECWDGAQLVGYSFMLDLKHAYWVAMVRTCTVLCCTTTILQSAVLCCTCATLCAYRNLRCIVLYYKIRPLALKVGLRMYRAENYFERKKHKVWGL